MQLPGLSFSIAWLLDLEHVFRQDIFPTPIWQAAIKDQEIIEKTTNLAYEFRDNRSSAGIVSNAWDFGVVSDSEKLKSAHGVTSFYSENLTTNPSWARVVSVIFDSVKTVLRDTYSKEQVDSLSLLNLWTTIYPRDAFIPEHAHSRSALSGVWYVKAPEGCGDIWFKDPSWVAKTMNGRGQGEPEVGAFHTRYDYRPVDGDLLIFPSWLPHGTRPNTSSRDRIIVSFNLDV